MFAFLVYFTVIYEYSSNNSNGFWSIFFSKNSIRIHLSFPTRVFIYFAALGTSDMNVLSRYHPNQLRESHYRHYHHFYRSRHQHQHQHQHLRCHRHHYLHQ
mmetsp:Transcript_1692/g.2412  ORF Transcript_1692/g.2412 Transcript_1692/m.2412 type:complete len:101 (-) Transcript_1692:921-1223(-)